MGELKEKTIKGIIWSFVDRFSVQGIQFAVGIILARLLLPEDYGVIAMLSIFIAVSNTFIDSGFSNALIRKENRTDVDFSTVFYFNIGVAIISYLFLFTTSPLIADFYNTPILKPLTKIIAINLITNSLCVVQQAKFSVVMNFKTLAKISIISVLISGITGIILAYNQFGVWSLAAQSVTYGLIRMILLWYFAKWLPQKKFSTTSFKELFSFGSKLLISGLLDVIYNNLYSIIIGKFYSSKHLGNYSRADHFAQFPSTNLTTIIQKVTYPALSKIQSDKERLKIGYKKVLCISSYIIFPLMIGIWALAEPLICFLLTEKWIEVVPMLKILSLAFMWYPVHAINLNILQVSGRSDLFLQLEVVKKIMGVCILLITVRLGIIYMCYGILFDAIASLFINTYYTNKLIGFGLSSQIKALSPIVFNAIVMGILVKYGITILPTPSIQLIGGFIIGIIYYFLSSHLLKMEEFKELISILKKKKI